MFGNRAFQVKVVKTPKESKQAPVEPQETVSIDPTQIAEVVKETVIDVVSTIAVGYISMRVITMTCRIAETIVRSHWR